MNISVAEQMLNEGISPLELVYYKVRSLKNQAQQGLFTELRINSLELGTLTPAQYRVITNRNNQSQRLSTWAFKKILPLLDDDKDFSGWISFYTPSKMLLRGHLKKLLENAYKNRETDFSRLVVEISSEVLYEDAAKASECISEIKSEFGVHFLLSEYGDEYCPVMRLPLFPFDYVMLDSPTDTVEGLAIYETAISVAQKSGMQVIAQLKRASNERTQGIQCQLYISEPATIEWRDA